MKLFCINCGDECNAIEETFSYAGTHCTNGKDGVHHTGVYVSDCCLDGTTTVDLSDWTITKNMKPIPCRMHDFDFMHGDYDGENGLFGTACNYQDAIRQIIEIEGE